MTDIEKDTDGIVARLAHSREQLLDMSLRDIETLLEDSERAMYDLKRKLRHQQGKADLMGALEVANLLKAGHCVVGRSTIHGFGSETIRLLIEEVEWRRKAMRDEDEGHLIGVFDGQFVAQKEAIK